MNVKYCVFLLIQYYFIFRTLDIRIILQMSNGNSKHSSNVQRSSSLRFYLFCLWNFTNNYIFCPLTVLLHCLVHPHCFYFLESKEGKVRRTTPDPFFFAQDTQLHKDSFAFALGFHSGDLRDQQIRALRVAL